MKHKTSIHTKLADLKKSLWWKTLFFFKFHLFPGDQPYGKWVNSRVGHAYAEYAVHADYARKREYAEADENSSTLSTYKYLPKMAIFGPKMGQAGSVFYFC